MLFRPPTAKLKRSVPLKRNIAYKQAQEDFPFNAHKGYAIFSYKGVVIEKQNGSYSVGKQIKIKGFPEISLMQLSGSFTSGNIIKGFIDYALESVDVERHATVREQYKNWKCCNCGTHTLYEAKYVHKVYRYIRNQWGEEEQEDTGRRKIMCLFCSHETPTTEIEWVEDEVML